MWWTHQAVTFPVDFFLFHGSRVWRSKMNSESIDKISGVGSIYWKMFNNTDFELQTWTSNLRSVWDIVEISSATLWTVQKSDKKNSDYPAAGVLEFFFKYFLLSKIKLHQIHVILQPTCKSDVYLCNYVLLHLKTSVKIIYKIILFTV